MRPHFPTSMRPGWVARAWRAASPVLHFARSEPGADDAETSALPSRWALEAILVAEWARAVFDKAPLSLMALEIDGFADYAAQYGQRAAAECLTRVGSGLDANLGRSTGVSARLEGARFAVLLPNCSHTVARAAAQHAALGVYTQRIPHAGSAHASVTVSIGVVTANPAAAIRDTLLEAAESALDRARRRGSNRIEAEDLRRPGLEELVSEAAVAELAVA